MGRSRGGLTTKVHALVDANGLPIALKLTEGQAHDAPPAMELLGAVGAQLGTNFRGGAYPKGTASCAKASDTPLLKRVWHGSLVQANIAPRAKKSIARGRAWCARTGFDRHRVFGPVNLSSLRPEVC